MTVIDKIYNYFDREPDLKVLFIFNDDLGGGPCGIGMERGVSLCGVQRELVYHQVQLRHYMGERKGDSLFPARISVAKEIVARDVSADGCADCKHGVSLSRLCHRPPEQTKVQRVYGGIHERESAE